VNDDLDHLAPGGLPDTDVAKLNMMPMTALLNSCGRPGDVAGLHSLRHLRGSYLTFTRGLREDERRG